MFLDKGIILLVQFFAQPVGLRLLFPLQLCVKQLFPQITQPQHRGNTCQFIWGFVDVVRKVQGAVVVLVNLAILDFISVILGPGGCLHHFIGGLHGVCCALHIINLDIDLGQRFAQLFRQGLPFNGLVCQRVGVVHPPGNGGGTQHHVRVVQEVFIHVMTCAIGCVR